MIYKFIIFWQNHNIFLIGLIAHASIHILPKAQGLRIIGIIEYD